METFFIARAVRLARTNYNNAPFPAVPRSLPIRYDIALSHASSPDHRMTILRAQADHFYALQKFELAASL